MPKVVSPRKVAATLTELWSPRIVGEVDEAYVKVAKVHGSLTSHSHENEDELFLVLKGHLRIEMDGSVVELNEGDMFVGHAARDGYRKVRWSRGGRESAVECGSSTSRGSPRERSGSFLHTPGRLETTFRVICSRQFVRRSKMASRTPKKSAGEELGLKLLQSVADALGISKRTLQEWEQGRRSPSGAAQTPIRIAERHPEVVREALG